MAYDDMKHMARTPMEQEGKEFSPPENTYPYGLALTLNNEELDKLGINCEEEGFEIGDYVHGHFLAEVVGYHKSDTGDGTKHSLNLQVTHMCLEDESKEDEEYDEQMGEGRVMRAAGPY